MTWSAASGSAAAVVAVAIAATFAWRVLGVALTRRIDPEGPVFRWFSLASYAVLAGLLTRLLVLPTGDLASVDLAIRLGAAGVAAAVFLLARRSLLAGVVAGTACFVLGVTLLG